MPAGVESYCKDRADAIAVYEVLSYRRACFLAFLLLSYSSARGKGCSSKVDTSRRYILLCVRDI